MSGIRPNERKSGSAKMLLGSFDPIFSPERLDGSGRNRLIGQQYLVTAKRLRCELAYAAVFLENILLRDTWIVDNFTLLTMVRDSPQSWADLLTDCAELILPDDGRTLTDRVADPSFGVPSTGPVSSERVAWAEKLSDIPVTRVSLGTSEAHFMHAFFDDPRVLPIDPSEYRRLLRAIENSRGPANAFSPDRRSHWGQRSQVLLDLAQHRGSPRTLREQAWCLNWVSSVAQHCGAAAALDAELYAPRAPAYCTNLYVAGLLGLFDENRDAISVAADLLWNDLKIENEVASCLSGASPDDLLAVRASPEHKGYLAAANRLRTSPFNRPARRAFEEATVDVLMRLSQQVKGALAGTRSNRSQTAASFSSRVARVAVAATTVGAGGLTSWTLTTSQNWVERGLAATVFALGVLGASEVNRGRRHDALQLALRGQPSESASLLLQSFGPSRHAFR